ncbi:MULTISPECIES: hypothetical protein [Mycobacteriaceae]|uniref:hypothetical protein n=1 Tax=Mycobacteriaceae TaxID=1762 RepID=UPI000641E66E|nr:hypothetical protein [Mycobacterium sp. EPa45]AKK29499.1 hypothetical protein AB431_25655 [Mycobacterium sp. EPa45]
MDPKDRIPHDDWADQDLLTKSEAAERLAAEIEQVTATLADGGGDEIAERRLAALKESYARMTAPD